MFTTNEIREKYLTFFESKGCVRRPSDVLVPYWDPSVLFTPAGMNQFKDHFLGRCKLDFTRATTCQKCLRTGDIDNVGRTAFHHTFFEMLGNFSFGDYFKREAIHWAWEFLTSKDWLAIDPEMLSATVYKDDHEAAKIWLEEIKLPASKLQYLDEDENFWPASAPSQGPDGVCGPCSEIYHKTPQGEVEIWNLVFTQFNRVGNPPDNLRPLPSKNIDTGMGLERVTSVLQGVETNFHIDSLRPLVDAAAEVCSVKYDDVDLTNENGRRLRRIADHIRACTFAIHENVYPGPKEEKYVIRRLLRRAVLDGVQMGMKKPFLYHLVPVVADLMIPLYVQRQAVRRAGFVAIIAVSPLQLLQPPFPGRRIHAVNGLIAAQAGDFAPDGDAGAGGQGEAAGDAVDLAEAAFDALVELPVGLADGVIGPATGFAVGGAGRKVRPQHRQGLEILDEAFRVVVEDDAGVEDAVGVEQRLHALHDGERLVAPLEADERGHVAAGAVFRLEGAVVFADDHLRHIADHSFVSPNIGFGCKGLIDNKMEVSF